MSEDKFTKNMMVGTPTDEAPFCVDGLRNKDGELFEVCSVLGCDDDTVVCDLSKANAHLFAVAPEMYKMLEFLTNNDSINDSSIDLEVKNLLAKARGEL